MKAIVNVLALHRETWALSRRTRRYLAIVSRSYTALRRLTESAAGFIEPAAKSLALSALVALLAVMAAPAANRLLDQFVELTVNLSRYVVPYIF